MRDDAGHLRGKAYAFFSELRGEIEEKPPVGGAVDGDFATGGIAQDAEASLLDAGGRSEPNRRGRVHQQKKMLTFAIAGGVDAVARVPDELAKSESRAGRALQRFLDMECNEDSVNVSVLRVRLDDGADNAATEDCRGLLFELREVARLRERAALRCSRRSQTDEEKKQCQKARDAQSPQEELGCSEREHAPVDRGKPARWVIRIATMSSLGSEAQEVP